MARPLEVRSVSIDAHGERKLEGTNEKRARVKEKMIIDRI